MSKSVPYRCPECVTATACGFNGRLVGEHEPPPVCDHNVTTSADSIKKPCHDTPVLMVRSRP